MINKEKKNIETYIVECCAPTLASLKTGNLFTISLEYKTELEKFVTNYDDFFNSKGLSIRALSEKQKILVYVYRHKKLKQDLYNSEVAKFLHERGYVINTLDDAIEKLSKNIEVQNGFPHEIGLFLGYPIDDVKSFIKENGQNFKACGYWKVYNNEKKSLETFEKFNKCKNIYCKMFNKGQCLKRLTVSA